MWVLTIVSLMAALAAVATKEETGPTWSIPRFVETPKNTTAYVGDNVTLVCRVESIRGVVQWTKGGFGFHCNYSSEYFPSYSFSGNTLLGDYSLLISNVTEQDADEFECQVQTFKDQLRSPPAYLKVLVREGRVTSTSISVKIGSVSTKFPGGGDISLEVAIGVGVFIIGAIVAVLLTCACRRWRRNRRQEYTVSSDGQLATLERIEKGNHPDDRAKAATAVSNKITVNCDCDGNGAPSTDLPTAEFQGGCDLVLMTKYKYLANEPLYSSPFNAVAQLTDDANNLPVLVSNDDEDSDDRYGLPYPSSNEYDYSPLYSLTKFVKRVE